MKVNNIAQREGRKERKGLNILFRVVDPPETKAEF